MDFGMISTGANANHPVYDVAGELASDGTQTADCMMQLASTTCVHRLCDRSTFNAQVQNQWLD